MQTNLCYTAGATIVLGASITAPRFTVIIIFHKVPLIGGIIYGWNFKVIKYIYVNTILNKSSSYQ